MGICGKREEKMGLEQSRQHGLRLAVFDLDGTLAPLGRGICPRDLQALRQLEERGVRIAVCSGKPTYYLCGFLRQAELHDPILIGENGAVIQMGVELPPRNFYILPYPQQTGEALRFLRAQLQTLLPDLWYQPNLVGLTPFPRSEAEFDCIAALLERERARLAGLDIYRHCDSFDIVPAGISKRAGLEYLAQLTGIAAAQTAAVGDGVNDYPMFDYAGYSIGIGVAQPERVDCNVEHCGEALALLHRLCSA